MYIFLDLSQNNKIYLSLFSKDFFSERIFNDVSHRELLSYIDEFLGSVGLVPKNLHGVMVRVGEGSFTSSRIAVVFANTTAFALSIPVIKIVEKFQKEKIEEYIDLFETQSKGLYVTPEYSGLPNIGGKFKLRASIIGLVQGMFFRKFIWEKAKELGLVGWVKNLSDGSVEIYAEGGMSKLQNLEQVCHHGDGVLVEKVISDYQKITNESCSDFQIVE